MKGCSKFTAAASAGVSVVALAAAGPVWAQSQQTQPASDADIVVTGVLRDTLASKAPIALTNVNDQKIRDVVPVSAADLLTEIPGVVVNSDNGETKNSVYARGLSNGTASGTFGYYWTQILEDGMPVVPSLYSNFQPDMFLRADVTTKRVQAVRGGSAAVTGPNAPGGLFNYISKTGLTDPGGMIIARLGLEGDDNVYQKFDAYYGARNDAKTFGWSLGGNYRRSFGYREIPYPLNKGGQIKGNVNALYDSKFGSGGLLFTLKYLNDHTGNLDSYRPLAYGFDNPQFTDVFGRSVNFLPTENIAHSVPFGADDSRYWNPSDFSHEESLAAGLKWDHDFGGGWKISNNLRVQQNKVEHTYATDIGYQSLLNADTFRLMRTQLAGLANTPGFFTLSDRSTGQTLARVYRVTAASQSGICVTPVSNGYCIDRTTPNLLPNQTIVNEAPIDSTNLILTVGSSNANGIIRSRDFMDLFTLTKSFSTITVTGGVYFSQSRFSRDFAYGGRGVMPLQNGPSPLDVTFQTTTSTTAGGAAGTVYQLTDPAGFGALGSSVGLTLQDRAKTREISPLFGITWEPNDKLLFDFGARYTFYRGWGENRRFATNPDATSRTFGGLDGDPLTLYDNLYAIESSATRFTFDKRVSYLQYSGAVSYMFSNQAAVYFRYTKGRKNQDAFWDGFNVSQKLADEYTLDPLPTIEQMELSLQYRNRWLTFNPVLFYTDLTNVPVRRNDGLLADGATRYTTRPFFSHYRSYGLELDNSIRFARWFDIRNVLTLNWGRSVSFASINLGTCNGVPTPEKCPNGIQPQDDDFAEYISGPQERAARVTYNGTANFHFGPLTAYYRFRYISSRPVTVRNTFRLPAQKLSDFGLRLDASDAIQISFNINNLFNDINPTQVSQVGTRPSNLTEEQFLELYPNALSQVQTNAPRS
ncbi:TonB-dependent receptor [Sphingobium sp. WW5]|uniref:TonB-dependent receptor domain-containing protein n=1 Tax=unclassified Sphingobium TaxID=2611147 RepID=UPI003C2228B7